MLLFGLLFALPTAILPRASPVLGSEWKPSVQLKNFYKRNNLPITTLNENLIFNLATYSVIGILFCSLVFDTQ